MCGRSDYGRGEVVCGGGVMSFIRMVGYGLTWGVCSPFIVVGVLCAVAASGYRIGLAIWDRWLRLYD